MNPDAEEAVTQRFHNAKTRLRNELQDQLQSRIESLDEQIESLEYIREKAELCNVEAKVFNTLVTVTDRHPNKYADRFKYLFFG